MKCPSCNFSTDNPPELLTHFQASHSEDKDADKILAKLQKDVAKAVQSGIDGKGTSGEGAQYIPTGLDALAQIMKNLGVTTANITAVMLMFEDEDPSDIYALWDVLKQVNIKIVWQKIILKKWAANQGIDLDDRISKFIGAKEQDRRGEKDDDRDPEMDADREWKKIEAEEAIEEAKEYRRLRRQARIAEMKRKLSGDTAVVAPDTEGAIPEKKLIRVEFPPDSGVMVYMTSEDYAEKSIEWEKTKQKKVAATTDDRKPRDIVVNGAHLMLSMTDSEYNTYVLNSTMHNDNSGQSNPEVEALKRELEKYNTETKELRDAIRKKEEAEINGQLNYALSEIKSLKDKNPLEELGRSYESFMNVGSRFGMTRDQTNLDTLVMTNKMDVMKEEIGGVKQILGGMQGNMHTIVSAMQPAITKAAVNMVEGGRRPGANIASRFGYTDDEIKQGMNNIDAGAGGDVNGNAGQQPQ
jgi:hypothetical protein